MIKPIKFIIIGLGILTLIDAGFLIKYIVKHSEIISRASLARLITFVVTHVFFVFMVRALYKIDQNQFEDVKIYRYSQWLVNTFVPVAAIDTFVEVVLVILMGTHKGIKISAVSGQLQDQELHLINFYFMTYMYATMTGILASIHLCVNQYLQKMETSRYENLVAQIMDKFLVQFSPNDPKIKDSQCSICQLEFCQGIERNENVKISVVNLECAHLFHQDCILEWVKKTYEGNMTAKCPNCRRLITS